MEVRNKVKEIISTIEDYAQKKFQFRTEIEYLMELSDKNKMQEHFDDLTFRAKFIINAYNLLMRVGTESSETTKLSIEFKKNLELASDIIRGLIRNAPDEIKIIFQERFEVNTGQNLENMFGLLQELSLIKNYFLDKRPPLIT
ncbi:MAG: hypothetical protein QME52_08265 [Bacteroidota bacterium]|nr:hypothetical protein [Bacteroidota bacterium]